MNTKTFLSSILGVAGLLLVGTFAPATFAQSETQDPSAPPAASQPASGKPEHGKDRFAGLNLTDDQRAQIKKIHEDAKMKSDEVMADTSLSDRDKQAKMKTIRQAARKQAHEVLTAEQREQLKARMRERHAQRSQPPSL
jgi:periplasmic protein CpxP/Spy